MINIYDAVAQNAAEALSIIESHDGCISFLPEIDQFGDDNKKISDYLYEKYDSIVDVNVPSMSVVLGDNSVCVYVLKAFVIPANGLRTEHIGFLCYVENDGYCEHYCEVFDDSDAIDLTENYVYDYIGELYDVVYIVMLVSCDDGNQDFDAIVCGTKEKARATLKEKRDLILHKSKHWSCLSDEVLAECIDIDKLDSFSVTDPCDDYWEHYYIIEKTVHK